MEHNDGISRELYEWSTFYVALGRIGPKLLKNVPPDLEYEVTYQSSGSDAFYSDSLYGTLDAWWADDPKKAIIETLKVWSHNVRSHFLMILGDDSIVPWEHVGGTIEWRRRMLQESKKIRLSVTKEDISLLMQAALVGEIDKIKLPTLVMQSIVLPYQSTHEGKLVRAAALPWLKIVSLLRKDWSIAYQIPPEKWEELIAAAFDEAGYDEVTLTPRSGDFGRDVIAVKNGVGSIRIINSVKAYAAGKLVRHDDVRALAGVLAGDPRASKGILTTTSDFAPKIITDPFISHFIPYRLELMNGAALLKWLEQTAKKKL